MRTPVVVVERAGERQQKISEKKVAVVTHLHSTLPRRPSRHHPPPFASALSLVLSIHLSKF